ncbi:MAG: hypothetical protein RLN72_05320, partial [Henriciella sp.]
MIRQVISVTAGLGAISLCAGAASAQEHSIIENSTVIGQNFGVPTGALGQPETPVGDVDLVVEAAVFAKNLELIDLGALEGETLIGAIIPLRARYRASENITFEFGAVLAQNFGDEDSLEPVEPLVRIIAEPADNIFVIGGTILPTHWSHQALFDDNNKFRDTTEQGLQFRVDRDQIKHESWINWRVREGVFDAEEFEISTATQLRFFDDTVRLDGQVHWTHAGGQISLSDRVDNNFVGLIGASVGASELFGLEAVEDVRIGAAALFSSDDTRQTDPEEGSGYEISGEMILRTSDRTKVRLHAAYFDGEDFFSRRGDPLYNFEDYAQLGAAGVWQFGD